MCDAKFTEGYWRILDGYQVGINVEFGDGFFTIASCQVFSEGKANAHLIAAAPEMYGLLEEMADYDECQRFKKQINQLLAKSRGEHA